MEPVAGESQEDDAVGGREFEGGVGGGVGGGAGHGVGVMRF